MLRQLLNQPLQSISHGVCSLSSSFLPHHDDRISQLAAENSAAEVADEASRSCTRLSNNPKSLHALWNEYYVGLGDNKAAMLFTKTQKGKDKSHYSKRLVFWGEIAEMIQIGWTSTCAIIKVIIHYGTNLSITCILRLMQIDRHNSTYSAILDALLA